MTEVWDVALTIRVFGVEETMAFGFGYWGLQLRLFLLQRLLLVWGFGFRVSLVFSLCTGSEDGAAVTAVDDVEDEDDDG